MKLNNLIFTALAGFSIILAGCQNNDENEQHYDNKLSFRHRTLLRKYCSKLVIQM